MHTRAAAQRADACRGTGISRHSWLRAPMQVALGGRAGLGACLRPQPANACPAPRLLGKRLLDLGRSDRGQRSACRLHTLVERGHARRPAGRSPNPNREPLHLSGLSSAAWPSSASHSVHATCGSQLSTRYEEGPDGKLGRQGQDPRRRSVSRCWGREAGVGSREPCVCGGRQLRQLRPIRQDYRT